MNNTSNYASCWGEVCYYFPKCSNVQYDFCLVNDKTGERILDFEGGNRYRDQNFKETVGGLFWPPSNHSDHPCNHLTGSTVVSRSHIFKTICKNLVTTSLITGPLCLIELIFSKKHALDLLELMFGHKAMVLIERSLQIEIWLRMSCLRVSSAYKKTLWGQNTVYGWFIIYWLSWLSNGTYSDWCPQRLICAALCVAWLTESSFISAPFKQGLHDETSF